MKTREDHRRIQSDPNSEFTRLELSYATPPFTQPPSPTAPYNIDKACHQQILVFPSIPPFLSNVCHRKPSFRRVARLWLLAMICIGTCPTNLRVFWLLALSLHFISSAERKIVPAHGKALIDTQISIAVPIGTYGRVAPRSGLGSVLFFILNKSTFNSIPIFSVEIYDRHWSWGN